METDRKPTHGFFFGLTAFLSRVSTICYLVIMGAYLLRFLIYPLLSFEINPDFIFFKDFFLGGYIL